MFCTGNQNTNLNMQVSHILDNINNCIELYNIKKDTLSKILNKVNLCIDSLNEVENSSEMFLMLDNLKIAIDKIHLNIKKLNELSRLLNFIITSKELNLVYKAIAKYNTLGEKYEKQIYQNDIFLEKFINAFIAFCSVSENSNASDFQELALNLSKTESLSDKSEQDKSTSISSIPDIKKSDFKANSLSVSHIEETNASTNIGNSMNLKENKNIVNKEIPKKNISKIQENLETSTKSELSESSKSSKNLLADNDTLLISETQNKVYLPYKISVLENKLQNSKNSYDNIEDLIKNEYILPLNRFKNSAKARFREAYRLMKYKEKASFFDCLELGIELAKNRFLNPAIIAACNSIDELDIYLDYLDENAPEKFDIFKIKYEVLPV